MTCNYSEKSLRDGGDYHSDECMASKEPCPNWSDAKKSAYLESQARKK